MNLTALQTALKRFGFDDSDPLTTWLNEAQNQLADETDWPFLSASETVALAADSYIPAFLLPNYAHLKTLVMEYGSNPITTRRLDYVPLDTFDRMFSDQYTGAGVPQFYTVFNEKTVHVWPPPSGQSVNLRAWYTKSVTDLVNGADLPVFPGSFHYAIVLKAAALGLQAENEEDRSSNAEQLYQNRVAALLRKYGNISDEPEAVQDVMNYGSSI